MVQSADAYGMAWKSDVMVNSTNNIRAEIIINDEMLEEVNSFKYIWMKGSELVCYHSF